MISDYLIRAGLEKETVPTNFQANELVKESIDHISHTPSNEQKEKLLTYKVPKLGPDGSCSLINELAKEPYNLSFLASNNIDDYIDYLQRLRYIVDQLQTITHVDWLGVYKKTKIQGVPTLVKESYTGIPSRAEFPLTTEFAKISNNSRVGITGKAVYFQDLTQYEGPYYECDTQVKSECCVPIFSQKGDVIGIIDAESVHINHFTSQRIIELATVADDISSLMQ